MSDDYLDRDGLLALGLDNATVDGLLLDTPLTGNDGRPVIEADCLEELLELPDKEEAESSLRSEREEPR